MNLLKNGKFRFFKFETAVVFTGIVMLLIGGMLEDNNEKFNKSYEPKEEKKVVASEDFSVDYARKYEVQIERILKGIEGVKSVKAAVYVKSDGERLPAVNDSRDKSVVTEKEGEKTAEERRDVADSVVVLIKDADGNEGAVILSEKAPEIEGVAVCVEGGVSKTLEEKIVRTLMALYDLPAGKISIIG